MQNASNLARTFWAYSGIKETSFISQDKRGFLLAL